MTGPPGPVKRNRGQVPTEQSVLKVLYLAVRNLQDYRRPTVGIRSSGWKQALQAFTITSKAGYRRNDQHHGHLAYRQRR